VDSVPFERLIVLEQEMKHIETTLADIKSQQDEIWDKLNQLMEQTVENSLARKLGTGVLWLLSTAVIAYIAQHLK
jgi:hypothetical protein